MNPKLRPLIRLISIPGWILFVGVPVSNLIGHLLNIRVALSAGSNKDVLEIWNFFATPHGMAALMVGGLLWLAALVWWPTQVAAHRQTAHAVTTSPAPHAGESKSTPKADETQDVSTEAEPEIECRGAKILRLNLNTQTYKLSDEGVDSARSSIAAVTFYRRPDKSPDDWIEVRAHIYVHELSEGRKDEVYDAVWLKQDERHVNFNMGDAYTLVIAACSTEMIGVFASDFKTSPRGIRRRYFAPKFNTIKGKDFQIQVELLGRRGGEIKLNRTFDFKLTLEPEPKIEEIKSDGMLDAGPLENRAKREYIIERLKDLIKLYYQLPSVGYVSLDDPRADIMTAYYRGGESFFRQYFDEAHVKLFQEKGIDFLEEKLREYIG